MTENSFWVTRLTRSAAVALAAAGLTGALTWLRIAPAQSSPVVREHAGAVMTYDPLRAQLELRVPGHPVRRLHRVSRSLGETVLAQAEAEVAVRERFIHCFPTEVCVKEVVRGVHPRD